MTVRDAKWIFEHASKGIEVNITNSTAKSVISKLKKPTVPPMKEGQTWDPTDPIAIYEQGG